MPILPMDSRETLCPETSCEASISWGSPPAAPMSPGSMPLTSRDELAQDSVRKFAAIALDTLSQAIPLTASRCYSVDAAMQPTHLGLRNLDLTWLAAYRRHFSRVDPLHPRHFRNRRCRVAVLAPAGRSGPQSREYLNDFLEPRGASYQAEVFLRDAAGIFAGFSLLRATHLGPFETPELRLIEALVPLLEISATRALPHDPRRTARKSTDLRLTERERAIAAMIAEGRSNKEICRLLDIRLPTVKTHVRHILFKANVTSRTAFVSQLYLQA